MLKIGAVLLLSLLFVFPVSAENLDESELDQQPTIQDVEGLRLNLVQHPQDPGSKQIGFDLIINPAISSDRVQVSWRVTGTSEVIQGNTTEQIGVIAGQPVTRSIKIKPRFQGVTTIRVVVEAFQIDGTRLAVASKTFGTLGDGTAIPPVEGQDAANLWYYIRTGGTIIIVGVLLVFGGRFAWKRISNWYRSDKY